MSSRLLVGDLLFSSKLLVLRLNLKVPQVYHRRTELELRQEIITDDLRMTAAFSRTSCVNLLVLDRYGVDGREKYLFGD